MKKPKLGQMQSVLIVDDNQRDIRSLRALLKTEYKVKATTTKERVFKAVGTKKPPDIILLNMHMSDIDGSELCKALKSSSKTWNIPVLFLTTKLDEEEEARIFEMGAADYIFKPYNPPVVTARIRTHAEIKKYRDCLEVSYYRDGLTGIPNTRRFEEYFDSVWSFAVRESLPLSLIKIRIVGFESYCEHYGQQAGDECIIQIAKTLSLAAKRKTDMLARCGREEFVCVLPNTRIDGAIILAETFRTCVTSLRIANVHSEANKLIGINQGVSTTVPTNDMHPEALVGTVDEALSKCMETGCNQINCISI